MATTLSPARPIPAALVSSMKPPSWGGGGLCALIAATVLAAPAPFSGFVDGSASERGPAVSPPFHTAGAKVDLGALGTTAVAPESWPGVAMRLAESLVSHHARAGEEPLFLPGALVWRFGRSVPTTPASLRDHFDGWRIVSVQAFEHPVDRVAAAIAGDALNARQQDPRAMPELLTRTLAPRPNQLDAAEATTKRWITDALKPVQGQRLAVLTLWNPAQSNRPIFERLAFLLVKADRHPADGRFRIAAVRYGTAQQAVIEGF